jgi:hypothetical protein
MHEFRRYIYTYIYIYTYMFREAMDAWVSKVIEYEYSLLKSSLYCTPINFKLPNHILIHMHTYIYIYIHLWLWMDEFRRWSNIYFAAIFILLYCIVPYSIIYMYVLDKVRLTLYWGDSPYIGETHLL